MGDYIAKGAIKVIEVIGVSDRSWEAAVDQAV
ncbi:MAG: dodecin domain-containing protein, partial [bacterium]|nr:dodecin domain-containing protein [bacterium]